MKILKHILICLLIILSNFYIKTLSIIWIKLIRKFKLQNIKGINWINNRNEKINIEKCENPNFLWIKLEILKIISYQFISRNCQKNPRLIIQILI
jgi:hypothetical protein